MCRRTNSAGVTHSPLWSASNGFQQADRAKFVCANEQYHLLWEDSPVTWRTVKCDKFLGALVKL